MSALRDVEVASGLVRRIEDFEASRRSEPISDVRPSVARRIGVTPEVLRNIRSQRRKGVPAWLMSAILRAWVELLEGELCALEHKHQTLKQIGADPQSPAMAEAEAQLSEARRSLVEAAKAPASISSGTMLTAPSRSA